MEWDSEFGTIPSIRCLKQWNKESSSKLNLIHLDKLMLVDWSICVIQRGCVDVYPVTWWWWLWIGTFPFIRWLKQRKKERNNKLNLVHVEQLSCRQTNDDDHQFEGDCEKDESYESSLVS